MTKMQRGFTFIELLGALAIGTLMMIGLSAMIDTSLEDNKAQQVALYQAQITNAASKYISDNYATLITTATSTTPAPPITAAMLAPYLPPSFAATNAYQQTPCVLVLQPAVNKLSALIVTEGGSQIPAKEIGYVAANAGQGGGYIPATTTQNPAGTPLIAQGAFGSWSLTNASLSNYLKNKCTGTTAGPGNLATALFYDGSGSLPTDFLYRVAVPGRPELNQMMTPLHMNTVIQATEDTSDARCAVGTASTWGGISTSALGEVLSCQAGVWKRQGTKSWRDPVATYATLPSGASSINVLGDVRMVTALSRAFTWNGTSWVALAVDQNGRLTTDDIQLSKSVIKGDACTSTGLISRDANGLLLTCQSGIWGTQSTMELGASSQGDVVILKSNYISYPAGTVFFTSTGSYVYDAPDDWYFATIVKNVSPIRDGMLVVNMTSGMNREEYNKSGEDGQLQITITIVNKDTMAIVGSTQNMSLRFSDDSVTINATLAKTVGKNTNGYDVYITTAWSTYNGNGTTGFGEYHRANYQDATGQVNEQTPIETIWNMDLFY